MNVVSVVSHDNACYVEEIPWNPSEAYPEYPFITSYSKKNYAYDMVRACFKNLALDLSHYGKPEWNPLGDVVKPGDVILIKPNWVLHTNRSDPNGQNSMNCLVTHPSIIRAVCDYCIIALKGRGRIVIGDAPVQDCDFDALMARMHYKALLEFYKEQGVDSVTFEDFRAYRTRLNKFHVIGDKVSNSKGVEIDLMDKSVQRNDLGNHFVQVANYDRRITTNYHINGHHIYSLAQTALDADLIINLPKPKTHRFAGMTGALKNLVGIACKKETLPHATSGSSESGGDLYRSRSVLKKIAHEGLSLKTKYEREGRKSAAAFTWLWSGFFCLLSKYFAPDPYLLGSWHGNDTIWRTIADLNYLILYTNKHGEIKEKPQRKIITLADMIIAGEGMGPLRPSPKHTGSILASFNSTALDICICRLMDFKVDKIPLLKAITNQETKLEWLDEILVVDNNSEIFSFDEWRPNVTPFVPHPSWTLLSKK